MSETRHPLQSRENDDDNASFTPADVVAARKTIRRRNQFVVLLGTILVVSALLWAREEQIRSDDRSNCTDEAKQDLADVQHGLASGIFPPSLTVIPSKKAHVIEGRVALFLIVDGEIMSSSTSCHHSRTPK